MIDPMTFQAFRDELEKIALISPAMDMAGLGMLAVPSIRTLRNKNESPGKKSNAKWEMAGLGTLGGAVAAEHHPELKAGIKAGVGKGIGVLKKGIGKLRPAVGTVLKHASIQKLALPDTWDPGTGKATAMSSRVNKMTASASAPLKKPQFSLDHLKAAYQKSGIKPGLKSVLKKVAAAPSMGALRNMHMMADAAKAAKGAKPLAQAAAAKPFQFRKVDPHSLSEFTAKGGHKFDPSIQKKRALDF